MLSTLLISSSCSAGGFAKMEFTVSMVSVRKFSHTEKVLSVTLHGKFIVVLGVGSLYLNVPACISLKLALQHEMCS